MEYIKLYNGVRMPYMIMGTYHNNDFELMKDLIRKSVELGAFAFDTAPSYGTEENLGAALQIIMNERKIKREQLFIIDKVDAWQMQEGNIEDNVRNSLKKLNLQYLDALMIHWPVSSYMIDTWKKMEQLYECGLVRAIGVCNMRERHLKILMSANIRIRPMISQIELSPLRTDEENIKVNEAMGIVTQAYSPLCRMIPTLSEAKIISQLSEKYGKSKAQIILRWHIDRNTCPIWMSSKPDRIKENLDVFDFQLSSEEIQQINQLNLNYKIFPESWGCPGY